MSNTMLLPPFLNAPLNKASDDKPLVEFQLRMNSELDLVENDNFDLKRRATPNSKIRGIGVSKGG